MKKIISSVCCFAILISALCACSDNSSNKNSSVSTADETANASNTYYNYQTDCQFGITNPPYFQFVTKGENGYYILDESGYIYYTDVQSDTATPLCNKPNCMHNDYECYAHIFSENTNIAYNNGCLYFLYPTDDSGSDYGTSIRRIAVDGSGASETVYNCEYNISKWIVHRDNLYIAYREYTTNDENGDNDKCRLIIEQIPIDNTDKAVTVYDSEDYLSYAAFDYLAAFDEYVYYSFDYQSDNKMISSLDCYDIKAQTSAEVLLPDGKRSDVLYIYPLADKLIFKSDADIYECDLNSENVKKVMTLDEEYHNIFTDGTYLYEDNYANFLNSDILSITKENNRILKVYDKAFNLIDTLDTGDYAYYFCPCDDRYFISLDESGALSYFDKSQIGNVGGKSWTENNLEILS